MTALFNNAGPRSGDRQGERARDRESSLSFKSFGELRQRGEHGDGGPGLQRAGDFLEQASVLCTTSPKCERLSMASSACFDISRS